MKMMKIYWLQRGFFLASIIRASLFPLYTVCSSVPLSAAYIPNISNDQLNILHDLYNVTHGEQWIWTDPSDPLGIPWNFTKTDPNPCIDNWQGVTCNRECVIGLKDAYCEVIELDVHSHLLNGTLPDSLGGLTSLQVLSLADNLLKGTIPNGWSTLVNVTLLDLSGNIQLIGHVPSIFGNWYKLNTFDISKDHFDGTIPQQLYQLHTLQYLDLSFNAFNDTINEKLCDLTQLAYVYLNDNHLYGTIPECIDKLQHLVEFVIGDNLITGTLPESVYSLSSLGMLDVRNNLLYGTISDSLGQLTNLTTLAIQGNLFESTFPSTVYNLNKLDSLLIYENLLEGPPPNISIGVSLYFIDHNYFSGSITNLNMSRMLALTVEQNFFTSHLPPYIHETRKAISQQLVDEILDVAPLIAREELVEVAQYLATTNYTGNLFYYLNCSANFFSGSIPEWIFTSPILAMAYMTDNMLSGSIPDVDIYQDTTTTFLEILFVDFNFLTGTIPSSIIDQKRLANIRLSNNQLSGTLSSKLFENSRKRLLGFAVDNNKFSGKLPDITNISLPQLRTLSFSNNHLTGRLYENWSNFPLLILFAVNTNCFSGSIPPGICKVPYISEIIMDGLSASPYCQTRIFPLIPSFTAFLLQHGMEGKVPPCLFELPFLNSLYLSGNLLTGTLPENVNLSHSLLNLRLSYNHLTGTIPTVFQNNYWEILDFSYNKLKGHLLTELFDNHQLNIFDDDNRINNIIDKSNQQLYLDVNRLSGTVPPSVRAMKTLSVLNDNIYYCDFSRRQLPKDDPKYESYSCASDGIYQAMLGLFVTSLIVGLALLWLQRTIGDLYNNFYLPLRKSIRNWNCAFELADHRLIDEIIRKINSDGDTTHKNVSRHRIQLPFNIVWRYFHKLRYAAFVLGTLCVCIFLPIYRILNLFQSMFEQKYSWEFSAIYMTGDPAGVCLVIIFLIALIVVYWILPYELKGLINKKSNTKKSLNSKTKNGSIVSISSSSDSGSDVSDMDTLRLQQQELGARVISSDGLTSDAMKLRDEALLGRDSARSSSSSMSSITSAGSTTSTEESSLALSMASTTGERPSRTISSVRLSSVPLATTDAQTTKNKTMAKVRTWLNYMVVGFIDCFCMTLFNMGYVAIVVYVRSQAWIIIAQIVLAMIKVWWNEVFIWNLVSVSKDKITDAMDLFKVVREKVIKWKNGEPISDKKEDKTEEDAEQPRMTHTESKPSISVDPSTWSTIIRETIVAITSDRKKGPQKEKESNSVQLNSNDVYLVVCCLLFNNIVAPCLGISIVSPACFFNALYAAGSISASYKYCMAYVGVTTTNNKLFKCTKEQSGTTTFSPPFIYSYTCSSALPVNYVVIYVYMVILSGFVIPSVKIVAKYLYDHHLEKGGVWHTKLAARLPLCMADLYADPEKLPPRYVRSVAVDVGKKRWRRKRKETTLLDRVEPLFDKHRFIVRCIGFLALLASFGVVFPPLAAVVACAICYYTFCEQMNIGRILHESEERGYAWYLQKLGDDLDGTVEFFIPALFPMVMIGSLLFSAILFDTFADQGGSTQGFYSAIQTMFFPLFIWGLGSIKWDLVWGYITNRKKPGRNPNRLTSVTLGVEMRKTMGGLDQEVVGVNPLHSQFSRCVQ